MKRKSGKVEIKWSPSFAYAIGVIASDGHIHKDGSHIEINSKDRELVENVKKSLYLDNKIGFYSPKDKRVGWYRLRFGDKSFQNFLNSIGITKRKSKTIQLVKVPDNLFADFTRGFFDGDGTFYSYWDKRWPNSFVFRISFASASKDFIDWLKNKLTELYKVKGFIKKGDGVFNLNYVKSDSVKLYKAMYYEDNLLQLERKKKKVYKALDRDPNFDLSKV